MNNNSLKAASVKRALLSTLLLVGICTVSAGAVQPIPGDPLQIEGGKVAGTVLDNGVHAYLGVPFAAPPVGELRWHEPAAVKSWTGIYDASATKPACAQNTPGGNAPRPPDAPAAEQFSEDCLYLNLWAPANAKAGAKLPVIVFIYGGGFSGGSASNAGYSGAELAKKGVIRVNLAYRVNVFGYFAHPELTRETGHNASGNWGSLDQVAGLKWIQRNIAAFGGDPANVTVMGQSAGGESVFQLQLSPLARGLFARLSGWSGANLAPGGQVPRSLSEGEAIGVKVQQILEAKNLADMRNTPWQQILAKISQQPGATGPNGSIQTRPIVDGYFMPDVPENIFKAGKQIDVPLYTSSTEEDLGTAAQFYNNVKTVAELQTVAKAAFGDVADEFVKLFPAKNDTEARKVALSVSGFTGFALSNRDWARAHALTGKQPVYLAQWTHVRPPNKPGVPPAPSMFGNGATHGSDIAYWLGNLDTQPNRAWTAWDRELSEKMQGTLLAFAKTSNPNTGDVKVPRYDPNNEQRVIFGASIYVDKMNTQQIEFLRTNVPKRAAPQGR